jgi:hypothetical protein
MWRSDLRAVVSRLISPDVFHYSLVSPCGSYYYYYYLFNMQLFSNE